MRENKGPASISKEMLLKRRYEIYDSAAAIIAGIEDAAAKRSQTDVSSGIEKLHDRLRTALAFLSCNVKLHLDKLRSSVNNKEALSDEQFTGVIEHVTRLHASLANLLQDTEMHPIEEILGMEPEKENTPHVAGIPVSTGERLPPTVPIVKPASSIDTRARELDEKAGRAMAQKKYKKALKSYKKLLELFPDRATVHNDMGLACRMNGDTISAIEHYRRAVSVNDQRPGERSGEYYNVFYNLGMALKTRSLDLFIDRKLPEAVEGLKDSSASLKRYIEASPSAKRKRLAAEQIRLLERDAASLEKMQRILEGGRRKIDFDKIKEKLRKARTRAAEKAGAGKMPEEDADMLGSVIEDAIKEEDTKKK